MKVIVQNSALKGPEREPSKCPRLPTRLSRIEDNCVQIVLIEKVFRINSAVCPRVQRRTTRRSSVARRQRSSKSKGSVASLRE